MNYQTISEKNWKRAIVTAKATPFALAASMVLLKSEGRKSQEIADFLGFCQQAVNLWLNRYKTEGINGLLIRTGRGRRSILSQTEDLEAVKKAVRKHRQRISIARAELEASLGKEFSTRTLTRYLKILTAGINESESA